MTPPTCANPRLPISELHHSHCSLKNMPQSQFKPGFRISVIDIPVLAIGLTASVILGMQTWWLGFIIGFTVVHFFLFCNVFRISRAPELIWAVVFTTLAGSSIILEAPSWSITIITSLILSSFLIYRETQKPHYHGVFWRRLNSELPEWWKNNHDRGTGLSS